MHSVSSEDRSTAARMGSSEYLWKIFSAEAYQVELFANASVYKRVFLQGLFFPCNEAAQQVKVLCCCVDVTVFLLLVSISLQPAS